MAICIGSLAELLPALPIKMVRGICVDNFHTALLDPHKRCSAECINSKHCSVCQGGTNIGEGSGNGALGCTLVSSRPL
jgi:hypothetical protein